MLLYIYLFQFEIWIWVELSYLILLNLGGGNRGSNRGRPGAKRRRNHGAILASEINGKINIYNFNFLTYSIACDSLLNVKSKWFLHLSEIIQSF